MLAAGLAIGWSAAALHSSRPVASGEVETGRPAISDTSRVGTAKPAEFAPALPAQNSSGEKHDGPRSPNFAVAIRTAMAGGDRDECLFQAHEIVAALTPEEFPEALAVARQVENDEAFLLALGDRWGQIDPAAAAAAGLNSAGGGTDAFLQGVMARWVATSPAKASAWVEALPPGPLRDDIAAALFRGLAENDPRAALQLFRVPGLLRFNMERTLNMSTVFEKWSATDSQSAAAAALELKGECGLYATRAVARTWGQQNPREAMAWAAKLRNPELRAAMTENIGMALARSDPAAAVDWVIGSEDHSLNRHMLDSAVRVLASRDLTSAWKQIEKIPAGSDRDAAMEMAVASVDVRSAADLIGQMPVGQGRTNAAAALCEAWATSDPRAALDWLVGNAADSLDSRGARLAIRNWTESAPKEAGAWALALPEGPQRDTALSAFVPQLAKSNPGQARELFDQLPPALQEGASERVTHNLFQQNPESARQWTEMLPEGSARDSAFSLLSSEWCDRDPAATARWLDTLSVGSGRDAAIQAFGNQLVSKDPAAALDWVSAIGDDYTRSHSIESLARKWLQRDPSGARQWIGASTQLTDAQRSRILEH